MKHSSAFISYLGYRVLFLNSILGHDEEKSSYMNEMNNLYEMNKDELLEILNYMIIMDTIFSNRQ